MEELMDEPIYEPMDEVMDEPIYEPMDEVMDEPMELAASALPEIMDYQSF
jgi:hypothetical protein